MSMTGIKKITTLVLAVLIISTLLFSFCGCSSSGFKQEDFELAITDVQVDGIHVTVSVEFKNKSWRNGWVVSNGLIHVIYYRDEEERDSWAFASVAIYDWIICKHTVKEKEELQLEKGQYTIAAIVRIHCNDDRDVFYYEVEKVIKV